MPLHRIVKLLGFTKPVVKGDAITLDVACASGEVLAVTITRGLWRQLNNAVLAAEVASHPAAIAPKKSFKRSETSAALEAVWADLSSGSKLKIDALAAKHGIGKGSISNWCMRHHPAEYVAIMRARKGGKPGSRNTGHPASSVAPASGLQISRPSAS